MKAIEALAIEYAKGKFQWEQAKGRFSKSQAPEEIEELEYYYAEYRNALEYFETCEDAANERAKDCKD